MSVKQFCRSIYLSSTIKVKSHCVYVGINKMSNQCALTHNCVFNICFTVHFYDSTVFTPTNAQFDIYLE